VEVRKELPFESVRKLSQEDLDAELKEWGGEALRAYNKARPGQSLTQPWSLLFGGWSGL
jgi:hypothetical protein